MFAFLGLPAVSAPHSAFRAEHKEQWTELMHYWIKARDEFVTETDDTSVPTAAAAAAELRAPAYAALAFMFATLPFEQVSNIEQVFSRDHLMIINAIYSYEMDKALPLPSSVKPLTYAFEGGPEFPSDWKQWRNHLFESASFRVSYFVYEWCEGLSHISMFEPRSA